MATLIYRRASAVAENGPTSLICRNAPESRVARSLPTEAFCLENADITPRHNPQMAASASVKPIFGELGVRGGVATVTTRASVEGNDCCCTDCVKRDRNVS